MDEITEILINYIINEIPCSLCPYPGKCTDNYNCKEKILEWAKYKSKK